MKTKVLMFAVLMGLTSVLIAQPKENGYEKSRQKSNPEMKKDGQREHENELDLTDAQKEVFKQNMVAMQKELQPIRNEIGEAEARQKTLTSVNKPDMEAINKNLEKIGILKTEIAKIQTKHHLEMRAQLTDEQRLKFDMKKHQMRFEKGHKGMKRG
jgi:Spy/CpxP family protein refolding chaperone